jgi:hypothetical protein
MWFRKPELCGRPSRRWEIDVREIGWKCVGWINVTQDKVQWKALVNTVMNLWVA